MADFNKDDKVKIISGGKPFEGLEGTILAVKDNEAKVRLNFSSDEDENRKVINIFSLDDLKLIQSESINKGVSNMEEVKFINEEAEAIQNEVKEALPESTELTEGIHLTPEELGVWCDANDAGYWTQDITEDNKVTIRGIKEELGVYDFNKQVLILNEGIEDHEEALPECDHCTIEDDFIHDYVYDVNVENENDVIPSWEFINKIATAESVDEGVVVEKAIEKNYKLFSIEALNFSKIVVAAKGITKDDIYNDYADYLEGNAKVREIK